MQTASLVTGIGSTFQASQTSVWDVQAQDTSFDKQTQEFANDPSSDAGQTHGDPIKKWIDRLAPPLPALNCDPPSRKLIYSVDEVHVNAFQDNLCVQKTPDPDVVLIKLLNIDYFPVDVTIPKGMELQLQFVPDETIEEVFFQVLASITPTSMLGSRHYLMHGRRLTTLKVHLHELAPGSKITESIDPTNVAIDMGFWTLDMASNQPGAKWSKFKKEVFDSAKTLAEKKKSLDEYTSCFIASANEFKSKHNALDLKGKEGQKKLNSFADDMLDKCSAPAGKAAHGFWNKLWNAAKEADQEAESLADKLPIVRQLKQLKLLWDNPGVLTEWTEAWGASFLPGHGKTTITVSPNPLADANWVALSMDLDCSASINPGGRSIDALSYSDVTGERPARSKRAFIGPRKRREVGDPASACGFSAKIWNGIHFFMRFDIITIFPDFFRGPLDYGVLRRAREQKLVDVNVLDLRAFTHDRHTIVPNQ
ncbi:MAG: hypothetical protein AUF65_02290 [Chloroflexi bacterium 13_1_20CM_50_12]|nr:MAG: hypothetical protein AUF65_02290 [Chloroflexi bacterium 13_1_20CM_50_12]